MDADGMSFGDFGGGGGGAAGGKSTAQAKQDLMDTWFPDCRECACCKVCLPSAGTFRRLVFKQSTLLYMAVSAFVD